MEALNVRRNANGANVAKFMPKRHQKRLRNNIMGVTRPAIRRLARRGGVIRIQKSIYEETRKVIHERITEIIGRIIAMLNCSKYPNRERKTVTTHDIVYVLKTLGTAMYGFDE